MQSIHESALEYLQVTLRWLRPIEWSFRRVISLSPP